MFGFSAVMMATGLAVGEQSYTTPGVYTFKVPLGVFSIAAVCVGAGGRSNGAGPGGGGLRWRNNIAVTPGQEIAVVVGASPMDNGKGGDSSVGSFVAAYGGEGVYQTGGSGTPIGGDVGGGDGGRGGDAGEASGGAGGAGGYTGNGGRGQSGNGSPAATSGSGGGGGGGGGPGYPGGGVGLFGQGPEGAAGSWQVPGSPGSGGLGAQYGGGRGGGGAVRIIWGEGRSFPSNAQEV